MSFVSRFNTLVTEEYIRSHPEGQHFERKSIAGEKTKLGKITEEVVGMLNAEGGVMVIGVSDNGEIQGIGHFESGISKLSQLKYDIIPTPKLLMEEAIVENKLIVLFHVDPSIESVYKIKDNEHVFLRVADQNRRLNYDQIARLEYDKGLRKYEDETIEDFDEADLDIPLLEEYKNHLNYSGDISELLYSRHLVVRKSKKLLYKRAAILLFSKSPEKYIPSASVRYVRFHGNKQLSGTSHNVIKDQRFEFNILRLISEVSRFLKTSFNEYYVLNLQTARFEKVLEYPEDAWLEALVNALCHRSYNIQGNPIRIFHYDDRIEFINSGPLPGQVTIDNIKTERFARNPRLARTMEDMGYVRQLNEGVSRIYETMQKSMLVAPVYQLEGQNVILILRTNVRAYSGVLHPNIINFIENEFLKFNSTQQEILVYMLTYHFATVDQLSQHTNVHGKVIRRYLNDFVERKILVRNSSKIRDSSALYMFNKFS